MNSLQWPKVQELFETALDADPATRDLYLRHSGAEPAVVETVIRMLEADAAGCSLLDQSLPAMAWELLECAPDREITPPTERFGPYRLVRLLGEGGMGVVWLGERADTDSLVAIKFLPNAGLSPARLERFTREVRLLAKLRHPCIARLYDAGTLPDRTPWFVMEYVPGKPFCSYAKSLQSMEEKLALFRRVCDAVQYAHSQEIIHRDLKPSNILVEAEGTPKLLDFGIARELQQAGEESPLTIRGPRFLSQHYAAPEWVREAAVGFTTDVYSLGVMLYEMLTDQLPQTGACADPGTATTPIRPSLVAANQGRRSRRGAWKDIDVLCLKAIHADPAKRYPSVEALGRDIDHFLRKEPLEAQPDAWSYRASKFVRRNAHTVALSAVMFAILITVIAGFTIRVAAARNAALAEEARSQRMQEFTLSLFKNGGVEADAPGNLSAETLVDRGAAQAARLTQDPELQAGLFENLAQMYQDIGVASKAAPLYAKALEIRDKLPRSAAEPRFTDRIELATRIVGQPSRSEQLIREAEQLLPSGRANYAMQRAAAQCARANVKKEIGRYIEAEALYKSAAAVQRLSPEHESDLAATLIQLSNVELALGNYDESDKASIELIHAERSAYRRDTSGTFEALQNLGTTAYIRGRLAEAEAYQREALALADSWYGKTHPKTANQMISLANVLTDIGKLPESGRLLHEAILIEQKAYPANNAYLAKAWHYRGRFEAASGQIHRGLEDFDRAAEIFKALRGADNPLIGIVQISRGEALLKRSDLPGAESAFRRALRILMVTRSKDDVYVALAHVDLGHALLLEQRPIEAAPHTQAGYDVLKRIMPASSYGMNRSHEDLLAEHDAAQSSGSSSR